MKRKQIPKPELNFRPQWEGSVKLWTIKYAAKNLWRVSQWTDLDDLLQDGYLLFMRVCYRYPTVIDAPHFMSLYITTYRRYITDLSRARTWETNAINTMGVITTNTYGNAEVDITISRLPVNLKKVLVALAMHGRSVTFNVTGRRRETTNEYLCRLANIPTQDIVGQARSALTV